jgi:hypothetical protein
MFGLRTESDLRQKPDSLMLSSCSWMPSLIVDFGCPGDEEVPFLQAGRGTSNTPAYKPEIL